jgi:tetratricopeptide (TPR) repeat protein
MKIVALAALVACSALAAPRPARADDAAQPWAAGVTDAQKAAAQKLLDAGNALFLDKKYADALDRYQQAVAIWDHPAIRFNIVRCDIQLDRVVEATDNLQLALKYGAAPLEEAVYAEALAYEKLLAKQTGNVDVKCSQPGVKVTLDGQPLVTCPGTEARRVAPGNHQLVGVKVGFVPQTTEVIVLGGKHADVALELVPLDKAGKIVHRWPGWVPWVVFGGGLAVAAMGGVLEGVAEGDFHRYDDEVGVLCPTGCKAGEGAGDKNLAQLASEKQSAQRWNDAAVGVLVTGVAATATGAVLLYMNRGRTVYPDAVLPVVTPLPAGGGMASLVGRF